MKKNFGLILAIALGLSALLLTIAYQVGWVKARTPLQENREGAPDFISYQGQIWDGDVPYDGDGYFMFAIINEGEDYIWSNDGSRPPETSIALPVTNGLFSVNLGDTTIPGMDDRLSSVHFDETITFLRVWFSPDDSTWTQMPDQQIAAVPYAYQAYLTLYADQATNADTLDTKHAAAFQLRVTESCPTDSSIRQINSDGSVLCEKDDSMTYTNGAGLLLVGDTFSADPDYLQRRVSTSCVAGSAIKTINSDGTVTCEIDDNTTYTNGSGLLLVGSTFSADSAYLQRRVSTSCVEGSAIKTINSDGSVICESIPNTATFSLSTIDSTGSVGGYSSLAIGTDGLGLISYYDSTNGNLKVAHCADTNCSSATSYTLDSVGIVGQYTSIAIGTDGFGLISYLDTTNWDLKVAHCNNTACSSASTYTLDSTGEVGLFTSIAIGGDGLGLISYYAETGYDLKVAHCNNTACSSGATSTILDSTGTVGYDTDIAIGTDGFGLISYYDAGNTNLKVAHCSNAVCSSATKSILDSTGNVGLRSSIAIGRDGLGLISYWDGSNGDLKVAHCTDTNCTSAYISNLDYTDWVGDATSIAIGIDGYGVISYWDNSTGLLKIAHCVNAICSHATVYILDTTYGGATDTSIAIGTDGFPLISYDDTYLYDDLKVAHCSNELCIPINWEH